MKNTTPYAEKVKDWLIEHQPRVVSCPRCGELFAVTKARLNCETFYCPVGCRIKPRK